jgi:hypothetical protein
MEHPEMRDECPTAKVSCSHDDSFPLSIYRSPSLGKCRARKASSDSVQVECRLFRYGRTIWVTLQDGLGHGMGRDRVFDQGHVGPRRQEQE